LGDVRPKKIRTGVQNFGTNSFWNLTVKIITSSRDRQIQTTHPTPQAGDRIPASQAAKVVVQRSIGRIAARLIHLLLQTARRLIYTNSNDIQIICMRKRKREHRCMHSEYPANN
jgi:hypothetical protein